MDDDGLAKLLGDPAFIPQQLREENSDTEEASLSCYPWKIRFADEVDDRPCESTTNDGSTPRTPPPSNHPYPEFSYLDLRRRQNRAWADQKLEEANAMLNPQEAAALFQQGLGLVPDHVDLLVAYGRLLADLGKRKSAIQKFQQALDVDPESKAAEMELKKLMPRPSSQIPASAPTSAPLFRDSSAYQNALVEKNLMEGGSATKNSIGNDDGSDTSNEERSRAKKRHKKKKRKRQSDSSDESDADSAHRRSKRRRRSHKRDYDSSDSVASKQRKGRDRHRKRHKHKRSHHSRKHKKHKRQRKEDE